MKSKRRKRRTTDDDDDDDKDDDDDERGDNGDNDGDADVDDVGDEDDGDYESKLEDKEGILYVIRRVTAILEEKKCYMYMYLQVVPNMVLFVRQEFFVFCNALLVRFVL